VKHKQPYDVFELPPAMTQSQRQELDQSLQHYSHVVSTEPREGAWVIGSGSMGQTVAPDHARAVQDQFEKQLVQRGWLKAGS
jgi:hypothetical protein